MLLITNLDLWQKMIGVLMVLLVYYLAKMIISLWTGA